MLLQHISTFMGTPIAMEPDSEECTNSEQNVHSIDFQFDVEQCYFSICLHLWDHLLQWNFDST